MPAYSSASTEQMWQLYGGRLLVFSPATVTVTPKPGESDPLEVRVTMKLEVVDGRLSCTQLCAEPMPGGAPITSESFRGIAVARLVAGAAENAGLVVEPNKNGNYNVLGGGFNWPPADFAKDGATDEALDHLARMYAFCMASGLNPNSEILRRYNIPKSTTTRWIATARRRGILVDQHRKFG